MARLPRSVTNLYYMMRYVVCQALFGKNQRHRAYHVVSAFVAENQLTLGEVTVEEKSNEITAVPGLLELVDVKGSIVTADAMS